MRRKHDDEAYDEWGNHAGDARMSIGNVNGNGSTKAFWALLGLMASATLAEAAWLGSAVIELKSEVAALNAKVDFLIADRRNGNGRP